MKAILINKNDSLYAFADAHKLVMRVEWCGERFVARFENSETKDSAQSSCLHSTHGNGDTVDCAIADYARKIKGRLIVVNAYGKSRKEIMAPSYF